MRNCISKPCATRKHLEKEPKEAYQRLRGGARASGDAESERAARARTREGRGRRLEELGSEREGGIEERREVRPGEGGRGRRGAGTGRIVGRGGVRPGKGGREEGALRG